MSTQRSCWERCSQTGPSVSVPGAGEAVATETVRQTAAYLGAAIGSLVNILNPEVLVLGNEVADHLGERLLDETRAAFAEQPFDQPASAVTLRLSSLPLDAVCRGAAAFAFERFLDDRDVFGPVSRARGAKQRARTETTNGG
ncbi:ROK family protein [Streptomyces hydrogenans]